MDFNEQARVRGSIVSLFQALGIRALDWRANYHIRMYLSFIQHKSLELACCSKVLANRHRNKLRRIQISLVQVTWAESTTNLQEFELICWIDERSYVIIHSLPPDLPKGKRFSSNHTPAFGNQVQVMPPVSNIDKCKMENKNSISWVM